MMPDLGKYADTVLMSYAATLSLLAAIVLLTLWRGAKMRRKLDEIEERRANNG